MAHDPIAEAIEDALREEGIYGYGQKVLDALAAAGLAVVPVASQGRTLSQHLRERDEYERGLENQAKREGGCWG